MTEAKRAAGTTQISVAQALERVEAARGPRYVPLFEHASLLVEYYAPRGSDPQKPHARDEVYVIARASGIFFDGTARRPFETGDLLFVAAGIEHRFEDFSDDFGTWVMFYGPEGGERV
jgi:mannose-6-phosphate isomerase-like protein (cupin superfamily)